MRVLRQAQDERTDRWPVVVLAHPWPFRPFRGKGIQKGCFARLLSCTSDPESRFRWNDGSKAKRFLQEASYHLVNDGKKSPGHTSNLGLGAI